MKFFSVRDLHDFSVPLVHDLVVLVTIFLKTKSEHARALKVVQWLTFCRFSFEVD